MRTSDRLGGEERAGRTTRAHLAWRLGLAAAASVALGGAAASCSLVVNTSSDQCTAVADCGTFPGLRSCKEGVCLATATPPTCTGDDQCKAFASAVCTSGVCVRSSCDADADCGSTGVTCQSGKCVPGGSVKECTASTDCTDKGPYFVCRKDKCVSLVNDLCTTVYTTKKNDKDAYLDDTAFIFGSILPTVGVDADYGLLVEDSIKLAIDDFSKVNGIPSVSGGSNRPLVLVGCNDGENEDRTDDAAKHLIDDLGVPAIIGYPFSGNTISVATGVTIAKQTLLFSPAATSNDITMLDDKDLVWRTSPRDDFQASALALYYAEVETKVLAQIGTGPVKVAIIHNNDPYGSGLADVLQGKISINGKPAGDPANNNNYKRFDYGDTSSPTLSKITDVVNFAPHVIFAFGFNEGPETMLPGIENAWTGAVRPQWVFSDGGQVSVLWNMSIKSDDLRKRVTGSAPGANSKYQPYNNFRLAWNASPYAQDSMGNPRSPDTLGPAGAYDITYMFAFSAVAVGQNPLTGPNMVKYGLRKMVPGMNLTKVTFEQKGIIGTFPKLTAGTAIDVEGASGPLDFDQFGEARSDIQIWCVPPGSGGATASPAIYSGRYYDSGTDKMAGSIDASCSLNP